VHSQSQERFLDWKAHWGEPNYPEVICSLKGREAYDPAMQDPALSILRAGSFPKDGSEPREKKDKYSKD
jgi:hypothetical protein